ncbi:hypothetical protein DXG03_005417 [Asterophora parasitica]|uniref:Uncharacterized protein n=1 Tax=Asterophora parasitica TaxID=117018 RepID=A0A9P7G7W9_9AGAR|nr:hypothetical protein DXG03_005417 [Asterophora parasitica]
MRDSYLSITTTMTKNEADQENEGTDDDKEQGKRGSGGRKHGGGQGGSGGAQGQGGGKGGESGGGGGKGGSKEVAAMKLRERGKGKETRKDVGEGTRKDKGKETGKGKKRLAGGQLVTKTTKKARLDGNPDDVPDLCPITPYTLERMKSLDRLLSVGALTCRQDPEWYQGASHAAELAYRMSHPAATDPGGAKIALISERQE